MSLWSAEVAAIMPCIIHGSCQPCKGYVRAKPKSMKSNTSKRQRERGGEGNGCTHVSAGAPAYLYLCIQTCMKLKSRYLTFKKAQLERRWGNTERERERERERKRETEVERQRQRDTYVQKSLANQSPRLYVRAAHACCKHLIVSWVRASKK